MSYYYNLSDWGRDYNSEPRKALGQIVWSQLSTEIGDKTGSDSAGPSSVRKLNVILGIQNGRQLYLLSDIQFKTVQGVWDRKTRSGSPWKPRRFGTHDFLVLSPFAIPSQDELDKIIRGNNSKTNKGISNDVRSPLSLGLRRQVFYEQSRVLGHTFAVPSFKAADFIAARDTLRCLNSMVLFALATDDRLSDLRPLNPDKSNNPDIAGYGWSQAEPHSLEPNPDVSKYYRVKGSLAPVSPNKTAEDVNKGEKEKGSRLENGLDKYQIKEILLRQLGEHLHGPQSSVLLLVYHGQKVHTILSSDWEVQRKGIELYASLSDFFDQQSARNMHSRGQSRNRSRSPSRKPPSSSSRYDARGGRDYRQPTPSSSSTSSSRGKLILLDVHELVLLIAPQPSLGYWTSAEELAETMHLVPEYNPADTLIKLWKSLSLGPDFKTRKTQLLQLGIPRKRVIPVDENGNPYPAYHNGDGDDYYDDDDDDDDDGHSEEDDDDSDEDQDY